MFSVSCSVSLYVSSGPAKMTGLCAYYTKTFSAFHFYFGILALKMFSKTCKAKAALIVGNFSIEDVF